MALFVEGKVTRIWLSSIKRTDWSKEQYRDHATEERTSVCRDKGKVTKITFTSIQTAQRKKFDAVLENI